jgi:hypothetical protein
VTDQHSSTRKTLVKSNEFSFHDLSAFPIVHVRLRGAPSGYADRWIDEMRALLQMKARFVLLAAESAEDESHEDRKARTQWLKANKDALAEWCCGLVSVEPDEAKRSQRAAQAAGLSRAFGLRMAVVADVQQAEAFGRECLARAA